MKKIGFDNDKYLKMQSEHIRERISKFDNKLYLEFGGKLYDDYHASRVLPGFEPDSKVRMLCQMKDIRGSLRRCQALEIPDHVELFEIKVYLQRLESLIPLFQQVCQTTHFKALAFHDPAQALEILDPDKTRSRGFYIPDNATPKLREIRAAKKQIEEQLHHAQTDAEKEELRSRRTRVCAEEDSEETKVRRSMGQALAPLAGDLLEDADTAGRLDFIIQKALFAVRYGGVRPEITETELELTDMINPELCDLLEQKGRSFVPVSIRLEQGATVITGANMGGKSVVMKTVALNVLLLQAGFLVCAKKARMPLFYSVKMLFDDLQSIQSGLSGFGSEIVQFQKALEEVEQGYSLFLLDEFARGTNPDEGAVIVQAVTKYLNEVKAISLLTTHYDKVAENARLHYQIIGLRDVDPEQIRQELNAHDIRDGILADLGCGTGELTLMLTQAGYDMIGIDQSEEMLCVVRDKAEQLGLSGKLLLLQQDLLKLDLYGTIRGAVSTFDTFNHIPDLDTAIANAAFFMEEGGVFLFDMNTPYKHQKVLGENVFTFEEEDAACVWRNHYHPADRRVEITVDIDYRETGEHFHEQFYEYTYDLDTIRAALEKHGFVLEKVCDGESFGPLTEESERYFFCAVKQYTQLEEKENV